MPTTENGFPPISKDTARLQPVEGAVMALDQDLAFAGRRQPSLEQPFAHAAGPERGCIVAERDSADRIKPAGTEIPQQHETGGLRDAGFGGEPGQLIRRDRLCRIGQHNSHLFRDGRCGRAALHDQPRAQIAERHGRHIGKGAPEHVEHHHQRRRQRDAADQQRGALPAITKFRWSDSANGSAGPSFNPISRRGLRAAPLRNRRHSSCRSNSSDCRRPREN